MVEDDSAPLNAAPDRTGPSGRFYSPLVRSIASAEGISMDELESISGSGSEGRVTKKDILAYVANRGSAPSVAPTPTPTPTATATAPAPAPTAAPTQPAVPVANVTASSHEPHPSFKSISPDDIVEMDRMKAFQAHG